MADYIVLTAMDRRMWHEFYRKYVPDPSMYKSLYNYDYYESDRAYTARIADSSRLYFAILLGRDVIGDIYLKHIDMEKREADFGYALVDDYYKNHGFGTRALRLLLDYSFRELDLVKIKADTVKRNYRSRHILEKLGFVFKGEDEVFRYYELPRDIYYAK